MTDRQEVPLETTEGWQQGSSGGERILVALAAIALLGAMLIVAGNLLKKHDSASVASASPRPTSRPSPTTRPSQAPQELVLVEQSMPPAEVAAALFNGWIRPKVDLPITEAASDGEVPVGTLSAGTTVYADGQPDSASSERGWLYVEGPGQRGYVATLDAGKDLVRRYQATLGVLPGAILSLAAGPHGLVAIGSQSGLSGYPSNSVFASADGVSWHRSGLQSDLGCCLSAVAWGPAGWLLVGSSASSAGVWIWSSQDGEDWRALGVLGDGSPQSLTASARGYLLVSGGPGRSGGQQTWFSTDGSHWTAVQTGLTASTFSGQLVAGTDAGFYAWADPTCCQPGAAFSPDGRTWSPVPVSVHGLNLHVVALGGSLIGISTAAQTGASQAWIGLIDGAKLSWHPMPGAAEPFGNAVVSALVSDGRHAIALGWDRTTEAAMAWISDGGSWSRSVLPGDFGGIPVVAAGGEAGVAVVGHMWNARGDNPVLWHWNGGASWAPERAPVVAAAPIPTARDCPSLPPDGISFVDLDRAAAVACLGNAPITVRMWSNPCDGCAAQANGTYQQAWLAAPDFLNMLPVSPVQWPQVSWANVVLDPSIGVSAGWWGAWLELTGHFDDPRAAACRWAPPWDQLQSYGGARSTVESCRQQFVVTAVRVVTGP